jgi:phosphate transport system substrate-binding protein
MLKKLVLVSLTVLASAISHAASDKANDKLTLTGSSTIAPLAQELAKSFEKKNPGVRVDVQAGGSSRGVNDARKGLNDIGMVSRALAPDEADLKSFLVARDGVCMIINNKNAVKELTEAQIISIFTGKVTNWKEVGGKDAAITVVNKAEGTSTLELFLHYFKLKNTEVKASVIIGDNQQGIKTVSGNVNAIGYVSVGSAEYDSAQGVPIKLLPMRGIAATSENVKVGKFPFARPLNLVSKNAPSGIQKKFIEYAQSAEANEIIKREYFVPIAK